jgi:hypothetical protein
MPRAPKPVRLLNHPDDVRPKRRGYSQEERLARYFAVSYIAAEQGYRSLDYVAKVYADHPIGEMWLTLARDVIQHLTSRTKAPLHPPTIQ